MESQLQRTHDSHGRHYDEHDILATGQHTSHDDHNEHEHHGEKKSVIKKVKEKAKKLKDTITKHGHGHGGHDHEHDEETVEDPEVHGAPMYDSARVGGLGGPDAILAQPRGNLERPSVMAEDRYTKPLPSNVESPPVSTGAYGTNLTGLGHHQTYGGQDVNPDNWRGTAHVSDSIGNRGHDVNQGGLKGVMGKSTGMVPDTQAPTDPSRVGSDPSNYETKVTNPTRTGGKQADLSQIQHSLDKMSIHREHDSGSEPKRYDPNHPEHLPHETLTEKLSLSASAIAEKAAIAKDVIVHKLGYSSEHNTTGSHGTVKHSSGSHETVKHSSGSPATDYAHKITDKVTETLAPVYEKVVDAGSSVMHKMHHTVSGTGTGTKHPHVHHGAETVRDDKGASVKEYLVETLKPGNEDKELSDVITHALHGENQQELEKKSREDKPMGIVTESIEVRTRLGTDRTQHQQHSGDVTANKNVTERLSEAVGSFFGGKGDAPQATSGTSYVTDEGLSSNPRGDHK